MFDVVIEYLPYLALAVLFNILIGTYNNITKLKQKFSWKKLFGGIIKAIIVGVSFIDFALIYDKIFGVIKMGSITIAPDAIILSSIVLYTTKGINNLLKILGLNQENTIVLPQEEVIEIPLGNEIK